MTGEAAGTGGRDPRGADAAAAGRDGTAAGLGDPVGHWAAQLATRAGLGEAEIARLRAGLAAFCAGHGVDPATLLATWLDYPELTVRRRHDSRTPPNLAVESFLIHNGINVFGDITCVPGRPEDLAVQGRNFVPGAGPP